MRRECLTVTGYIDKQDVQRNTEHHQPNTRTYVLVEQGLGGKTKRQLF